MYRDKLTHTLCSGSACISCCFYRSHIATNEHGYEPAAYMLFANKSNVCCLYHGISSINCSY